MDCACLAFVALKLMPECSEKKDFRDVGDLMAETVI